MRYLTERSKVVALRYIKEYSVFEDLPDYDVEDLFEVIMYGYRDGKLPNVNKEAMESLYVTNDRSPRSEGLYDYSWTAAQMSYNHNTNVRVEVHIFHKINEGILDTKVVATSTEGYEHLFEYEYPEVNSMEKILEILDSLFVTATALAEDVQQDIDNDV